MEGFCANIKLQMSIAGFDNYKNELETMKLFLKNPLVQMSVRAVWDSTNVEYNTTLRTRESINFREQGNKLFQDSLEKNALAASRFYTKAIFAATAGSEALAFAHANRAMALQKFGYFQQAYDDCECALEQGYPKNLRYKVITRQAICAAKLGEPLLLQKHIDSLAALSLNETYTAKLDELRQSLEQLKFKEKSVEKSQQNVKELRAENTITKTTSKGRCLIAKNSIKKDDLIFTERAISFIPINRRLVCQHCAATQLIPFPCYNCNGWVIYCSLKCRIAHQVTHAYECLGYQKGTFDTEHNLALRMVLDGIPEIMSFLSQKRTAMDIWNELTCEKSSLMQSKLQYTQSLSMVTHLKNEPLPDIFKLADGADLFSSYLRYQTNFFNLFKKTKASLEDWHLIIASLILRHEGQLLTNGIKVSVLTVKFTDPFESSLLLDKLWRSPFHVRRGFLHMFCNHEDVIYANFPYYNHCNYACYPTMSVKNDGRYLSAYAVNNIEAGAEILTSHTSGSLNIRQLERQSNLMKKIHLKCGCVKRTKEYPDEDYEKFHRFRCEKCNQIFIAETAVLIQCTECGAVQHKLFEKLELLKKLLRSSRKDMCILERLLNARIKAYEDLDEWLVGPHDIKFKMSIELVEKCFEMADIAFSQQFSFYNFSQIIEILKFHLRCKIERYNLKSNHYVGPMTYLCDFIALGKYQCTAKEMEEMLQAIEILPDETKKFFINYYNDYIVGNIQHK